MVQLGTEVERVLLIRSGESVYGLPVACVRRIVSSMTLWPAAGSARALVGLGRFGGEPLAVLSFDSLLGDRPPTWSGRSTVIVVRTEGGDAVGLAVDEAQDVVELVREPRGSREVDGSTRECHTVDGRSIWCVEPNFLERKNV